MFYSTFSVHWVYTGIVWCTLVYGDEHCCRLALTGRYVGVHRCILEYSGSRLAQLEMAREDRCEDGVMVAQGSSVSLPGRGLFANIPVRAEP